MTSHRLLAAALSPLLALASSPSQAQLTTRVSLATNGTQADRDSGVEGVAISADGRFVAFTSASALFYESDANATTDVFVHDRATGETRIVSLNPSGSVPLFPSGLFRVSISADGRFVAFDSAATSLTPGDTNAAVDVFVHDCLTASTGRASVRSAGGQANGSSFLPAISADGRFVAFVSAATNLVPGDTNGSADVFLHDRDADGDGRFDQPGGIATVRVSVDSSGAQADGHSSHPSISADGRFIAFECDAGNLVPGDTNGVYDVFVHDRSSGATERVSVGSAGEEGDRPSFLSSVASSISADGRFVAFTSYATNLVPGDTNGVNDTFLRDRVAGSTVRLSVSASGEQANEGGATAALSADGRFAAFVSRSSNLVPADTNGAFDLFVRDSAAGTTFRANVSGAQAQGDSGIFNFSISADGLYAVFSSDATNLVTDDTNGVFDVFVRDLAPVRLARVEPASGSEAGGDLMHVVGRGFTAADDTTVLLGGVPGAVISLADDRVTARTPPGSGAVAVTVSNSAGSATLPAAYRYLSAAVAARHGNVNVGRGDRENVLLVNAAVGDETNREMTVRVSTGITVAMINPSSRQSARYAVFAWMGAPDAATLRPQPAGVGPMVFPTPLDVGVEPQPFQIGNHLDPRLGAPTFPTSPAPSLVGRRARGIPRPLTLTLQGFIQDNGSRIPERVSITNAVILHVVP
jgi:TolB protein